MSSQPRTILVTGCTGFIAKHVVRELLAKGYAVRGTLRSPGREAEVRAAMAAHVPGLDLDARLGFARADLLTDDGWAEAMEGIDAVLHTASPFPAATPRDENALIRPAVEGTMRVLKATHAAGIGRVVLTSSVAAVNGGQPGVRDFDARNWTVPDSPLVSTYTKSKTLAERAAWEYARSTGLALTAINPALVLGPSLDRHIGTSLDIVAMMLKGRFPLLPRVNIGLVDVRDVARLHVLALEAPETAGERIIASERFIWFREIAELLKEVAPNHPVATREAPDWLVKLLAVFVSDLKNFSGELSLERTLDGSRASAMLGGYIPSPEAIAASVESLYTFGLVQRR
jgi:dihydroflavonol-4-reductase